MNGARPGAPKSGTAFKQALVDRLPHYENARRKRRKRKRKSSYYD